MTVLEGDALETLKTLEGTIDLLFLDGMKHLYRPVLALLQPRLAAGALVIGDNADTAQPRACVEHVRNTPGRFLSSHLFGGRMVWSS